MEETTLGITAAGIFFSPHVFSIVALIFLIFFFLIILLIACNFNPLRCFSSRSASSSASIKVDDIERPLISEDPASVQNEDNESVVFDITEQSSLCTQDSYMPTNSIPAESKHMLQPLSSRFAHNIQCDSSYLDIPNTSEDSKVVLTLKRPIAANLFADKQLTKQGDSTNNNGTHGTESDRFREFLPAKNTNQGSNLSLEVISGPCLGLRYSFWSTDSSKLKVSIGRVSPGDVILKDSEVSGKHAMIFWNANKLKWELVDMGSLNGTRLNSKAVQSSQSESRNWSDPIELSDGDTITLGTSSEILVHITSQTIPNLPFGIGKASDPMASRRGGKKLPMEDVSCHKWPLPGYDQFGVFGIFDGHGGADAATSVSKLMPETIAEILSSSSRREKIMCQCDSSDVLREAFSQTEARLNNHYEGCTATVVLVWGDHQGNFFVQSANVGDSACIANVGGKVTKMTEDHRISSHSERLRIQALGSPLGDGVTRLHGINLSRMLGDKYLKEQDSRFSSEPYVSEACAINSRGDGFVVVASDGFWDVVNVKRAVQVIHEAMSRGNDAEKVADILLTEARMLRTKDNTSIIFLDFSTKPSSFVNHSLN